MKRAAACVATAIIGSCWTLALALALALTLTQADYGDGRKRELQVGGYFGEIGILLQRTQCLATVRALKPSAAMVISREGWASVFPQAPVFPEGPGGGRGGLSRHKKRDLTFTLQLDLLLKLQRHRVPLEALMMHRKGKAALFDFTITLTGGALRPTVYSAAFALLDKVSP